MLLGRLAHPVLHDVLVPVLGCGRAMVSRLQGQGKQQKEKGRMEDGMMGLPSVKAVYFLGTSLPSFRNLVAIAARMSAANCSQVLTWLLWSLV